MSEKLMTYLIVDTERREVREVACKDIKEAQALAGLAERGVDHGTLGGGLAVVVYEYGLFAKPDKMKYWALAKSMFAGNAVIYRYDELGNTVDVGRLPPEPPLRFVDDPEREIAEGKLTRPQMSDGSSVIWRWGDATNPFGKEV